MATEQGIVIRVGQKDGAPTALVKTVQSSACKACSARHQCNPNVKGTTREVEVANPVDAREGDLIQISMDTGALLKTTFLLYVFPIICMLIGAFAGHIVGETLRLHPSMPSMLSALASFVAAMLIVRRRAGVMALKREYQPKITRILGRGTPDPASDQNLSACGTHVTSNI